MPSSTMSQEVDYGVLVIRKLPDYAMAEISARFPTYDGTQSSNLPDILERSGHTIRAVVTGGMRGADAALMDRLPSLQLVSCISAGVEGVDLTHAKRRGVTVTNTSRALYDDVADTAIGLMLGVTRRLVLADRYLREGRWPQGEFPLARSIAGKTMGILGMGSIGLGIARRAEAMGMAIAYCNRQPRNDVKFRFEPDLERLAARADVLVISCPGGAATRGLVGRTVIEALGPEGYLINIARGSVIDEPALIDALTRRRIAGAGLDVFASEPDVPAALIGMENVMLLPHIGSGTEETRNGMMRLAIDNLIEHSSGRGVLTPVT